MFYIVFFVTNYFSLGIGVWLAIRHDEILRMEMPNLIIQAKKTVVDAIPVGEEAPPSPRNATQISANDSFQAFVADESETVMAADETPLPTPVDPLESPAHVSSDKESHVKPVPRRIDPASKSPLPSVGMIEQVIGMAESVPEDDLQGIISQLQEIHGVIANADKRCYVSEDADSFVTPEEEKYVTTAICRPTVGCKR